MHPLSGSHRAPCAWGGSGANLPVLREPGVRGGRASVGVGGLSPVDQQEDHYRSLQLQWSFFAGQSAHQLRLDDGRSLLDENASKDYN